MANKIPLAIADFETQLSGAISASDTTLTLASATDDDGNALPAGMYCFTVNNGSSNKQYLIGQLNGTTVTSVKAVSRQGVETAGAAFSARSGSPVIISDFATIQRVADILRGQIELDGSNPMLYDAEPTLSARKEIATVGYVLDTVVGGSVTFDAQVIAGTGGENIVAGDVVYFETTDQEWYLTDADDASTVTGTQLGIALGTGSNGVTIAGGIQIAGTFTTTGLTPGATYYAANVAGDISATPGTTSVAVGVALSATKLLLTIAPFYGPFTGAGEIPTETNKFLTQDDVPDNTLFPPMQVVTFTGNGTWTKDAGLKYVVVEVVGGGGGGGSGSDTSGYKGAGGGGGGYAKKLILAASLGATESVTVGTGGAGGDPGATGNTSSFGAHCSATGGAGGVGGSGGAGGTGGTGSSGNLNVTGGRGISASSSNTYPVGDGGHTVLGYGGSGQSGTGVSGGTGGAYGGGGGGSGRNATGGTGGAGIVIVTEYYS